MKRLALAAAALACLPAQAADKRIQDLPQASSLTGFEKLPIILQDNLTMNTATLAQIAAKAAPQFLGAWSSSASYVASNIVSYNGSSYIAIAASTNQAPPNATYWTLLAQAGANGAGNGTVTNIATGTGLTGGPITATGTIALVSPVAVANGGTGATAAGGTALDNITGFATTGLVKRTGTGTYTLLADPLPVANGGTGIASGTSGGIPCYTGATTLASSGALGQYAVVTGGGPGVCPTALGSLGSYGQTLHANSAAAPYWDWTNYGDISSASLATAANVQANAASKIATPNALWGAGAVTALTDGATVNVDMSTGINFGVTLGGNRALGAPTNTKVGQTGLFRIAQDATGSRTLSFNAVYKFAAGAPCTLSTPASAVDYIFYFVYSSTEIMLSCSLNVH